MTARVYRDPRQRRRPTTLQPLYIPKQPQSGTANTAEVLPPPISAELIHPGDLMVVDSDKFDWTPPIISSRSGTPTLSCKVNNIASASSHSSTLSHSPPSIISCGTTCIDAASIHSTATVATEVSCMSAVSAGADVYGWEEELNRKISSEARRKSCGSELNKHGAYMSGGKARKSLLYRVLNVNPRR